MPSFEEVQFPTKISFGSSGGPSFSTDIVTMKNGSEQRNINWGLPLSKYNIANGVKNIADFDVVKAFFYARKGRAIGFRYKDWADYLGVGEVLGTGDGGVTDFQLIKNYISGSAQTTRNITKPVAGTVSVYLDAVLQPSGYGLDTTTGVISFATAPLASAIISCDFEFDVPVRFDSDELEAAVESNTTFGLADISLIEVRV